MAEPRGRVLLADPRGYCAGVDRAVVAVERALEIHGAPVYVRKQIVHNKHVVATLERRGAVFVEETDEVPEGAVVVFSAPGVSPAVTAEAQQRSLTTVDQLKNRFPGLQAPPSDDICYATQNRQQAVKQMAAECDLVLVVGSTNSSNSVRLVEVALEAGSRSSYLVDYAAEIDEAWLEGVGTVGVTSGASVPEILVDEVLEWLAARGFADVETVKAAEERLVFALPHELRRAEKAARTV